MKRKGLGLTLAFLLAGTAWGLAQQNDKSPRESREATVTVLVTSERTGKPLRNARLTLRFGESGKKIRKGLRRRSWSAKTNSKGTYRFTYVPKGRIVLLVTAENHQSLGREFEVYDDNATIEVTLKKPQPLL